MRVPVLAALAAAVASAAWSVPAQVAAPLSYAVFEPSVTHLDLEHCPKSLARNGVFCRLSIGADMVHVWVFEEGGDQTLVEVRSYGPDEYELTLK